MPRSTIFAFGLLVTSLTAAQAEGLCNYADIANAEDSTKNMRDASQKDDTMREVAMARQSMAMGDRSGCASHMQRLDQLSHQR